MALIKVTAKAASRAEVLRIVDIFRGQVVDVSPTSYTLEITGNDRKIQAVIDLLSPIGIIEIVRTGKVAIARHKKDRGQNGKRAGRGFRIISSGLPARNPAPSARVSAVFRGIGRPFFSHPFLPFHRFFLGFSRLANCFFPTGWIKIRRIILNTGRNQYGNHQFRRRKRKSHHPRGISPRRSPECSGTIPSPFSAMGSRAPAKV